MDSAATNYVITDLNQLNLRQPYQGLDDIIIGDGTNLSITHSGSLTLPPSSRSFSLSGVLCVPSRQQNLISVSQFCNTKHSSVEFFPTHFLVKDLTTGAPLL